MSKGGQNVVHRGLEGTAAKGNHDMIEPHKLLDRHALAQLRVIAPTNKHVTFVEQMSRSQTGRCLRRHERQIDIASRHLRFQLSQV